MHTLTSVLPWESAVPVAQTADGVVTLAPWLVLAPLRSVARIE